MDKLTQEFIAESREGLERMERCLTELERRPGDGTLVAEIFRAVHTIKGGTGFLGFERLERLSHGGEELLGALRGGELAVSGELISGLLALVDRLREVLRVVELTGGEGNRKSDDDKELMAALMGFTAVGGPRTVESREDVRRAASGPAAIESTLRVEVRLLNRLMNLVGDLVLTRNQMMRSSGEAGNFSELVRRLDGVTAELRVGVMEARMQPVGHLFGKFPRMVRDLARTCGRQVRVEFEGQETGLDKSLLEAVRDPLTHAVRNAVDHGIEPAEDRVRLGKPAEGVVRLRAFQRNGMVTIEVVDDGAGIRASDLVRKAVERGLVTEERAKQMSEQEALELIFVAGMSLSPEVTHVSGRGVGMDVVRANVEEAGGSVEVESEIGMGTTVRLRVPLTLAIVPALVVRSGGQSFAVPQSSLAELVYVAGRDRETAVERMGGAELYRLRGRLLPLVWLDRVLELERGAVAKATGMYIAVVGSEGCRFGLVVDEVTVPEEIVVKPLSATLRESGVFSGATVLGDGTLAMILDVAGVGARAGMVQADVTPSAAGAGEFVGEVDAEARRRPMVVYETRSQGRTERRALPLSLVERIEEVRMDAIEFVGGRALLRYGEELLRLEDAGGLLRERDALDVVTVVMCQRPGTAGRVREGLVVQRVLDVAEGRLLPEGSGMVDEQLAMVDGRMTAMEGCVDACGMDLESGLLQGVA